MEKGEYRVSLDTLFRILGEFGMGISEFFDEVAAETLSSRDVGLIRAFNTLTPVAQKEVQEFIAFKREHENPAAESAGGNRQ